MDHHVKLWDVIARLKRFDRDYSLMPNGISGKQILSI